MRHIYIIFFISKNPANNGFARSPHFSWQATFHQCVWQNMPLQNKTLKCNFHLLLGQAVTQGGEQTNQQRHKQTNKQTKTQTKKHLGIKHQNGMITYILGQKTVEMWIPTLK